MDEYKYRYEETVLTKKEEEIVENILKEVCPQCGHIMTTKYDAGMGVIFCEKCGYDEFDYDF